MGMTSTLGVGIILSFFISGTSALTGADRAMSKLVHTTGALSGKLTSTGRMVMGFLGGIIALKVGMAGLNFVMSNLTAYATYEREMLDLQGLLGNTAEGMADFEAHALSMARTYAYTAGEVAQGMWRIASAGFTQAEVLKMTESVLQYATIGHMDLAAAAFNLSNVMRAFHIPAEDAQYTLDRITATMSMYQLTMADFQTGFATWGMVAANTNQSLEEMLALWGSFTSMGLSVSRSGMMVKMMLTNLMGASPQSRAIRQALGIDLIDQSTGQIRSLIDIMADLQGAMQDPGNVHFLRDLIGDPTEWGEVEGELYALTKIFGRRAIAGYLGAGGLTLEREDVGMLESFDAIMYDAAYIADQFGYAQEYTDTMMSGWDYIVENIKTSVDTLNILLGKPVADFLKPMFEKLHGYINDLSKLLEERPETAKITVGVISLASFATAAFGVFLIVGNLFNLISKATHGAITGWKILGGIITFLPKLLIGFIKGILFYIHYFFLTSAGIVVAKILAIAGIIIAGLAIGFGIGTAIQKWWTNIKSAIVNTFDWLLSQLSIVGDILAVIFMIVTFVARLIWGAFNFVADIVVSFIAAIAGIGDFKTLLFNAWADTWVGIWGDLQNIGSYIVIALLSALDKVNLFGVMGDIPGAIESEQMIIDYRNKQGAFTGSYGISKDQWAYLHEGEQVVQSGASSYQEDSTSSGFSVNGDIHIHLNSTGDAEVDVDNIIAAVKNRFNSDYERVMA